MPEKRKSKHKNSENKKRRKTEDPSYNKRNYPFKKKKGEFDDESIFKFYGDHNTERVTSVLINMKNFAENFPTVVDKEIFVQWLSETLREEYKKIPTHAEVLEILETTELGTPTKVKVDGKVLTLKEKASPYYIFNDNPKLKDQKTMTVIDKMDPNDPFLETETYKQIKTNLTGIKTGKITVTPELLKKSKIERESKTLISQNKAMVMPNVDSKKGSATNHVNASKLFSSKASLATKEVSVKSHVDWQWGHGIAKFVLGELGQDEKYLAAITKFANHLMFFTEADIPSLTKKYPEGFDFEFTYELIKPLQIAHTFKSRIITKDFIYEVTLNTQTENEPHIAYRYYMHKNLESAIHFVKNQHEIIKDKKKAVPKGKLPPKTLFGNLFVKTPVTNDKISDDNIKTRLRKKNKAK